MKINWLGHACFLITTNNGTKIMTDPYLIADNLTYGEIEDSADIVTVSHNHGDHNNISAVRGNPEIIRGSAQVKGVEFKGIPCHHDEDGGRKRGSNTIFCFDVDGIRLCHLGDLGHDLSDEQAAELGKVDVLLIPVGGYYTIDAATASRVSSKLASSVIIPMHYKNDKCSYPITGVEDFLRGKKDVNRLDTSEVELMPGELPTAAQIIILKPAR